MDIMPKEQFEFIEKIKNGILERTNMTDNEAYEFAFRIWQNKVFLADIINSQS